MLYFDYAATTPLHPDVIDVMSAFLADPQSFGNASSQHSLGKEALRMITLARANMAELIGAQPQEIIFTSGATESINMAVKGVAWRQQHKGKHLITTHIEHSASLETSKFLGKQGFAVTYLYPDAQGRVNPQDLQAAIRDDTILVSIMHVNNETGVIQDIARFGQICHDYHIPLHVDAAQSVGKLPLDVEACHIDLLSLSAHKFYGPKGIGALYIRSKPQLRLRPLLHGGGQEFGMRPGTLATHQIVGLGKAAEVVKLEMAQVAKKTTILRDRLWQGIKDKPGIMLNGCLDAMSPFILNINLGDRDIEMLSEKIAFSAGSACHVDAAPSHVLIAMGVPIAQIKSSVRFSLGHFTTKKEIDQLVKLL